MCIRDSLWPNFSLLSLVSSVSICMPNLKFLAQTVAEIWRESQNFKCMSRDSFPTPFEIIFHFPIDFCMCLTTVQRDGAACDCLMWGAMLEMCQRSTSTPTNTFEQKNALHNNGLFDLAATAGLDTQNTYTLHIEPKYKKTRKYSPMFSSTWCYMGWLASMPNWWNSTVISYKDSDRHMKATCGYL